jgi:hypothetical protein
MENFQKRQSRTLNAKQHPPKKFKAVHVIPVKRHTHSTIAGLEDLTAIVLDIVFALRRCETFLQATENEIQTIKERADVAINAINIVRISPHAYPVNERPDYRKLKTRLRRN